MVSKSLPVSGQVTFEELKKTNEHGAEYWSAQDLQPLLGYGQWRRFEDAINRAMVSCGQSGNVPENHFAGAGKMVGSRRFWSLPAAMQKGWLGRMGSESW